MDKPPSCLMAIAAATVAMDVPATGMVQRRVTMVTMCGVGIYPSHYLGVRGISPPLGDEACSRGIFEGCFS
jgi:hypothetical protein